MKRLLIIILLLFFVKIQAQDQTANVLSSKNSSTTELDSAGVFTGTAELLRGYNSISITIRADQNGTYKVLFGHTSSTVTTAEAVKTYSFSYTANDTNHTKNFLVDAPYFKVVYTNDTVAQTKFYLTTMLNKGQSSPTDMNGNQQVADTTLETTATELVDSLVSKWVQWLASDWATKTLQEETRDTITSKWVQWLASDWATKTLQEEIRDTITAKFVGMIADVTELKDSLVSKFVQNIAAIVEANDSSDSKWTQWLASDWATETTLALLKDSTNSQLLQLIAKDFATETTLSLLKDTTVAFHATLVSVHNLLANDSLTVKDIVNLKNLLTLIEAKDFSTETTLALLKDTTVVQHATLVAIQNLLANDSLNVVDIINLKNLLTLANTKSDLLKDTTVAQHATIVAIQNLLANDSLTVQDMTNLKQLLTQVKDTTIVFHATLVAIQNLLANDSLAVQNVLGIKQNQINGTQITKVSDLPAITYGSQTLINAVQLDDSPTSVTSAAYLIGNKNKIGFSLNYNETEVGGGVSGTLTLEVSPDSSAWYAFDIILDGAGLDAPNASLAYSSDATDYFYLPNFVTAGYIRATFAGTNTDADDTIVITVVLHWQAE